MILAVAPPSTTEPLCNQLNNRYYHQPAASADSAYTFPWATVGGTYPTTRLVVGDVEFLVQYDAPGGKVALFGVCGNTNAQDFSVQNQTLLYQKSGFNFEAQFFIEDSGPLKIKVLPRSNTKIEAFR
ncbi:MAG: hypothetical protein RMJ33_06355 [Saprospiraceae bacterium]|nr:hypothetical protein [Saprospiraceae bacterium]MDW8229442.1 hypothetical protein [Saprospiraceae bacterium]